MGIYQPAVLTAEVPVIKRTQRHK